MPRSARGWEITAEELRAWTIHEDEHVLALNKPAHVVCHPSKTGPWSSLAGACREYLGLERIHLPVRLDRETSGVVVVVKDQPTGSQFHNAVTKGRFRKSYLAIVTGTLRESKTVDAPLGRDLEAEYSIRQTVVAEGGRNATTEFEPVSTGGGFTLVRAIPHTGRTHQIRVHAAWMGYPIVGDKLYGPDPRFMLEFVHNGFTDDMRRQLLIDRQALHASKLVFCFGSDEVAYSAPLAADLVEFCRERALAVPGISE
jgi:23S rRNA pseudouridine1911/1915/1917 synthase